MQLFPENAREKKQQRQQIPLNCHGTYGHEQAKQAAVPLPRTALSTTATLWQPDIGAARTDGLHPRPPAADAPPARSGGAADPGAEYSMWPEAAQAILRESALQHEEDLRIWNERKQQRAIGSTTFGAASGGQSAMSSAWPETGMPWAAVNPMTNGPAMTGGHSASTASGRNGWPSSFLGRIKSFNQHQGFGFIESVDAYACFGRDVFLHRAQIGHLSVGTEITFAVELNQHGMPQARDVLQLGRFLGRIKSFNGQVGFGFIGCEEATAVFGRDVFLHKAQVGDLKVGTEVTFVVELNAKGMPQAQEVKPVGSTKTNDVQTVLDAPILTQPGIHESSSTGVSGLAGGAAPPGVHDSSLAAGGSSSAPAAGTMERFHGRVKSFNEQNGFGFIECAEATARFGRDVFVHKRNYASGQVGTEVTFAVELNHKGMPQARELIEHMPLTGPP